MPTVKIVHYHYSGVPTTKPAKKTFENCRKLSLFIGYGYLDSKKQQNSKN